MSDTTNIPIEIKIQVIKEICKELQSDTNNLNNCKLGFTLFVYGRELEEKLKENKI